MQVLPCNHCCCGCLALGKVVSPVAILYHLATYTFFYQIKQAREREGEENCPYTITRVQSSDFTCHTPSRAQAHTAANQVCACMHEHAMASPPQSKFGWGGGLRSLIMEKILLLLIPTCFYTNFSGFYHSLAFNSQTIMSNLLNVQE